jgi:predicted XRE-type DNA-binding protein
MASVVASSGNIFKDLGLPNPEEHLLKAELSALIGKLIKTQGLTQTQAAQQMGLKQPDVSNILRGKFAGFSIERMLVMLLALGADVSISIKAPATKTVKLKKPTESPRYPKLLVV